ncbi:DNA topoisomerase 2-like isoform X1 [Camellia sinensis]|uniref:DNA topoisomerase 2-like isoform X1 n=1 Tax=Camellia sinensis TaxID=4442 RepID=UPI0010366C35|nr:DNA topoisomerase 2-like isoform X1 [Camellia sinensis]
MASNDVEKVTEQIPVTKDPLEDYREHNDDTTVHFEVIMSEENLIMAKQEGLLKKFKLTTTISTSNMHLFDPKGVIKKYETPEQILEFHESEVICQT